MKSALIVGMLEFLHEAPLFGIGAIFLSSIILKLRKGKTHKIWFKDSLLLSFCSIGIGAGTNVHTLASQSSYIMDPCLIYSAVLIVVAAKLLISQWDARSTSATVTEK